MRDTRQRIRAITRLPWHVIHAIRAAQEFRDWPALLVRHAAGGARDRLTFRDGSTLHLTSCPVDCQTAHAVYGRRDYDPLPSGGGVMDIGANFGAFAVRAARHGNRVVAVEPNSECFAALQLNAQGRPIELVHAAVWSRSGEMLAIAAAAHPGNSLLSVAADTETAMTVALDDLVSDPVDYLKMDCEGAEYTILRNASRETLRQVRTIALEYHDGPQDIPSILTSEGFRITRHRRQAVWGMDYGFIRAER